MLNFAQNPEVLALQLGLLSSFAMTFVIVICHQILSSRQNTGASTTMTFDTLCFRHFKEHKPQLPAAREDLLTKVFLVAGRGDVCVAWLKTLPPRP